MVLFNVIKFIFKNNKIFEIPFYLFGGLTYQIFKRCTGRIISKKIFNNKEILLFPNCNISTMFTYTKIPDRKEIEILRSFSSSNTVFLDIGANIGSHSLMLVDKVKKIYAFEPHPVIANRCRMNFLLNNVEGVFELAINDKTEQVFFSNDLSSSTTNKIEYKQVDNIIKVEAQSLDDFAKSNFDKNDEFIVKIDTEGCEEKVLLGGVNFFKNYNVKGVIFESFSDKKDMVFKIFEQYGYSVKLVDGNNYLASRHLKYEWIE